MSAIFVGIGGALGAMCRFGTGELAKRVAPSAVFPIATLTVNILGSFLIGLAAVWFGRHDAMGSNAQLFIMTGVMGGFTTFSSFSLETVNLIGSGRTGLAAANVLISVAVCLLGVWLGKSTGNALF